MPADFDLLDEAVGRGINRSAGILVTCLGHGRTTDCAGDPQISLVPQVWSD
jgi:hypothetical protein